MLLLELILALTVCCTITSAIPMIVHNNARFDPADIHTQLVEISSVTTQNECACQCYANSSCITGTFIGSNQSCILFNAHLSQGHVRLIINNNASVISFPNRTINTNLDNLPEMIEWLFDGNFNDVYGRYNGNLVGNNIATWISPGYNGHGHAVYLNAKNYSLVDHYLNLTATSFTISAWIWIPYGIQLTDKDYFILFGHCQRPTPDRCLHIGTMNGTLYFGFYADDLSGNTELNSDQWYHVAYVYDRFSSEQLVYLNGNQDANRTSDNFYAGDASHIVLGAIPEIMNWTSFRTGYIGKLTFVSRIKNNSELLNEATLVAYYPFDGTYLDFGPNQINSNSVVNTIFDANGRFNQSLVIGSVYPSFFQATGFYYLCQANYAYSFSMWIYPLESNGTILQVSSPINYCVPMIGFNIAGRLTIQTLGSNGIYATSFVNGIVPLIAWTHISMTYSTMNGIQLFVNGSWVNSNKASTDYLGGSDFCTIILGTGFLPNICAVSQTEIVSAQFRGKIDELKIFSRELSPDEIYQMASV